ncbi:hypothetical protein [Coralliovum pocilloporae]|uniref:hypothetical protein n=1 Tax=Coralliovum pocilloporae TaxID=3066369 RepID=UPI00330791F1
MIMSVLHISGFRGNDLPMRAALAAGWSRADLWWERLQEEGLALVGDNRLTAARSRFLAARLLATLAFDEGDPRLSASLACLARLSQKKGRMDAARRQYNKALVRWPLAEDAVSGLQIKPRARSSLFHLRMEARHWDTYSDTMRKRLAGFVCETELAIVDLSRNQPPRHRLASRWQAEKPPVFDDTRKLLGACLLVLEE